MNSVREIRRVGECSGGHCPWRESCRLFDTDAHVSVFDIRNFKINEKGPWTYYCAMFGPKKKELENVSAS